jgi:hypothetical protein
MRDAISAALKQAGPDNWHFLIAPVRTLPLTEGTAQAVALAMDSPAGVPRGPERLWVLADLAAATGTLSNAIANALPQTDALGIFIEARAAANLLNDRNRHIPQYQPTFTAYNAFHRAAATNDPQVLTQVLIDVIRIAYWVVS